ncbi:hypothetical protein [Methylobacterium brachythecii]|uniref:Uncharacterized protein n=1 Tax=Methylobacterium brachythecii TaxID=1176177 RepID=A0A7W6F5A6_9HYPH|nr:hypothetical protein [Methylobacterium brachythecii]MBB3901132.1 hypothetical protein [Methylobacterium brachythecii]GLS45244.1 hypothetical protein GCM10007884_32330 [Methylobacterium brachythecii]
MRLAVLNCSAVLMFGLAPTAFALTPKSGEPVLAVSVWPAEPIIRSIAASDARILWLSPGGQVAIVQSSETKDLAAALYRNGASIVLAADLFSACLPTRTPR